MGQGAYRHQRFSLILIIPSGDVAFMKRENTHDVGVQYFDHCSQARRPNRTVSIETKSPKLNTTLPPKTLLNGIWFNVLSAS